MVQSLRHRDFSLLWFGQLVNTVGNQMQGIAISWHVYVLTDSPLALGLIAASRTIPFMILSLLGGTLADAVDRRRMLLITQMILMGISVWLLVTTALGIEAVWVIYVATFCAGVTAAFDGPARQALIPNLVPREDLAGALALNTLLRQAASIFGPGLGGFAIAHFGVGTTYGINALSFLAVIAAILMMRTRTPIRVIRGSNWQRLVQGISFARQEPLVLLPLLLDFATRFCGSPQGILPVFVRDIFQMGPEALGLLSMATSAGAISGGMVLGALGNVRYPVAGMIAAYCLEGLCNMSFGLFHGLVAGMVIMFFGGICNVVGEVLRVTIAQLRTPDEMRGRVTALTIMLDQGGPGLGRLEVGFLTSLLGPITAVSLNGAVAATLSLLFAALPPIRPRIATKEVTDL